MLITTPISIEFHESQPPADIDVSLLQNILLLWRCA